MAEDQGRNLRRNLGVSRRDLLRRGAIAGGTLIWAAPVLKSLSTPAFAQGLSPFHSCCVGAQVGGCGGGRHDNIVKFCDHIDLTSCQTALASIGATFVTYQSCTNCLGYTCVSGCEGSPGVDRLCHEDH